MEQQKEQLKGFNIRVYGLIFNEDNQVLLSDEYQLGMKMTKFPGGGMKYGESTVECLQREAMEEFGQSLNIKQHFYTLDYFQPALFYTQYQLISIYYLAEFSDTPRFKISHKPFDFEEWVNGAISFRWKNLKDLNERDLTLPVDKKVVAMLQQKHAE